MSRPPPTPSARRVVESYDAAFRLGLTVPPESADDPAALAAAAAALPASAAALLELLVRVGLPGEPVPERLRGLIERVGEPLWRAALLLPRQSHGGGDIHPLRYAGSCRLNPALVPAPPPAPAPAVEPTPAFPPSDARWDAIVVAALLGEQPGALTQDGALRRDVERRIHTQLGGDPARWALALQVARLSGLVRPAEGRLRGFPESVPRPLGDPAALFGEPLAATACTILLRALVAGAWVDLPALLSHLRASCRELLCSPLPDNRYPDRATALFDDAGWEAVEDAVFRRVADTLHRAGLLDAARDGAGMTAVRRAGPRPGFSPGFLLTPDGDILVHAGELSTVDYGRLARLAPFVEGERVHRHRLAREGVAADLAAGHTDPLGFLATHSRTGLPPNIADTLREWQRSATRITVVTGVDIEEDETGALRIAPAGATGRVIDYARAPRARFLYEHGRVTIPDGWDALGVRACVERVARFVGREGDARVYAPEWRPQADARALLSRLVAFHGGELPGELEALVLSGEGLPPVRVEPAWLVHLPAEVAGALRRDWIAGPMLRRAVPPDGALVAASDLPALRARFEALGLHWEE